MSQKINVDLDIPATCSWDRAPNHLCLLVPRHEKSGDLLAASQRQFPLTCAGIASNRKWLEENQFFTKCQEVCPTWQIHQHRAETWWCPIHVKHCIVIR